MDIVIKGPKGGETKIIKDNGADFQKSFLSLTYVKRALGESFEEIQIKENQRIAKERLMLADVGRKSPKNVGLIDSLKDKILKKETEKKSKRKKIFCHKTNRRNSRAKRGT